MNVIRTSENTILIAFDQVINAKNFSLVNQCATKIKEKMANTIVEIVVAYASIHITFNLTKISGLDFLCQLKKVIKSSENTNTNTVTKTKAIIHIPVYYGDDVALDLPYIAEKAKLSKNEVIKIHTSQVYDVYAIGFSPGFAYLGNVDSTIATPRKETPRKKISQGSVGIADQQTAIYPSDSPGGWQIIGKTPIALIDYDKPSLTQFSTGDKVKFFSINKDEFFRLSKSHKNNSLIDDVITGETL